MKEGIEVIVKKDGEVVSRDSGDFCIVQVVCGEDFEAHVIGQAEDGVGRVFDSLGALVSAVCQQAADGSFR